MEYPKFYRLNGRCMKLISESEAYQVTLVPDFMVPLRTVITGPERVQEELRGYEETTVEVWEDFCATFRSQVREEAQVKNQRRQALWEKQNTTN